MKAIPSKPLKVVVIDDEPVIVAVLAKALRNNGYEVETYASAVECLANHQSNAPCPQHADVILTDMDMPHMNGIEFLNLLDRRKCPCKHIALMTGSGMGDTRLHKIEINGVKLFLKPFSIAEFIDWVSLIQRT